MKIKHGEPDVRKTMQPLERLDLSKYYSVKDLVDAMRLCSFGARMLGNVAKTLAEWCWEKNTSPVVIYDGAHETPTHKILCRWQKDGWCKGIVSTQEYFAKKYTKENVLVVGEYMQRFAAALPRNSKRCIFISKSGQTNPGQVKDGYFPDLVASDPSFIIPVLNAYLRQEVDGVQTAIWAFVQELAQQQDLALEVWHGAQTLRAMIDDPDTTVFMTLSGAMTVAKMGYLIDDMINLGMIDYLASTGALMAHGLTEGLGLKHYAYDPKFPDQLLADQGLNRVTDALEPEENFDEIDDVVNKVLAGYDGKKQIAPSEFHRAIGAHLKKHHPGERAILKTAYEKNVPIIVPAFADSEIGNDVFVHNMGRKKMHLKPLVFNQELDTTKLLKMATSAKKLGIFSIGGGVPRNNTQNVAPLIEIINNRLKLKLPPGMFTYGCRIDPTPLFYGNLSGCTYSEGGSWRKFDLNGMLTEVHADATIVWPFILKYVMSSFQGRSRKK